MHLPKIEIAPMLDWTDRHCRYFLRLISSSVYLYTEMLTTGALLQGKAAYLLQYHPAEQPLVIQLGGSNPADLAKCAKMAEQAGYSEVNLNLGCPSNRVQLGKFGACLMAEPSLVAECISAMCAAVTIPITVKTRLGIDDIDNYDYLLTFVSRLAKAGCSRFIIHARKAWLKGLSPKQNREIPPLRYEWVYKIKQDLPQINISINGGIKDLDEAANHLRYVDSVMLGRAAYQNPYLLAQIDQRFYANTKTISSREAIIHALIPYIESELIKGNTLNSVTRHILGLFNGLPGAKQWRRTLTEHAQDDKKMLNYLNFIANSNREN